MVKEFNPDDHDEHKHKHTREFEIGDIIQDKHYNAIFRVEQIESNTMGLRHLKGKCSYCYGFDNLYPFTHTHPDLDYHPIFNLLASKNELVGLLYE